MATTRREIEERIKAKKEGEKLESGNATPVTREEVEARIAAKKAEKEEAEVRAKSVTRADVERRIERKKLEAEQERANAEQKAAGERLDFAESSLFDRAEASLAQLGVNMGKLPRAAVNVGLHLGNEVLGTEAEAADFGLDWLGRGEYVPEGTASREALDMGTTAAEFAMGAVPVARSGAAVGSNVMDVLGMGATEGTELAAKQALGKQAIPEMHRNADADIAVREIDWNNEEMVGEVIARANAETATANLSTEMAMVDEVEGELAKVLRETQQAVVNKQMTPEEAATRTATATKKRDAELKRLDNEIKPEQMAAAHDFGVEHAESVIKTISRRYDMPIEEATAIVNKNGGVTPVGSFSELRQMRAAQKANELYVTTGVSSAKGTTKFGEAGTWSKIATFVRPTTALIRENVGKGAAAQMERSLLRAEKNKAAMQMKYESRNQQFKELVDWAERPEVKRAFMDLKTTGSNGRYAIVQQARRDLNQDSFETFMDMIGDSDKHQRAMNEKVWRGDQQLDQVYWGIDARKTDPKNKTAATKNFEANKQAKRPENVTALSERNRGQAANMDDMELAAYDNPILSQYRRLTEDQDLLELASTFDLPTGMKVGDGISDFAAALGRQTFASTGDINKSTAMETLSSSILTGSRQRPNKWIQRYMTQSYAGTLGQFDSAVLNIHDAAISAWRNGAANTGRAIFKKVVGKGVDPRDFGVGDAHVAEFREGMNKLMDDPSRLDKALETYSDAAFTWSGFKAMDMAGKGIVMGAALEQMRKLAGRGDNLSSLSKQYGHFLSTREMAEVSNVLKKGTDMADMTARQRDIIGDAMLGKLAEQQLMAMSSRPLAYLNNPNMRPLWAMAGFAIKQGDILKTQIVDNVALGNYSEAGTQAALWALWGVTGYAAIDTIRDMPAYALSVMGGEPKEAKAPGAIGQRLVEGAAGPITLNRAGDLHSLSQIAKDPVGALGDNILNPVSGGTVGIAGRAAGSLLSKEQSTLGILAEAVPSVGRYMSTYLKSKHKTDRKMEKLWEFDESDLEDFEDFDLY